MYTYNLENIFKKNEVIISMWKVFQKKFAIKLSFEDVIGFLKVFISDMLNTIALDNEFEGFFYMSDLLNNL